jgi:Protein of unknown function (DUF2782)
VDDQNLREVAMADYPGRPKTSCRLNRLSSIFAQAADNPKSMAPIVRSSPASLILLAILIGPIAVTGADTQGEVPVPPPPALPPADSATTPSPPASAETIEPEITITGKGSEIHEEYRYNGLLYMIKVIPSHGPPYYLIYDERGRSRRSDLEPNIIVPQWVIKRF